MSDIRGQRVLVTGAASGIGKELATALCDKGATVVALDVNKSMLNKLKEQLPSITTLAVDLTDWDATRRAVESVLPLPLVVNCAGIGCMDSCLTFTLENMNRLFAVNTYSLINISQVVGSDLVARRMKGSIVNVSSMASRYLGDGTHFSYSLSKICVDMVTRQFALALGPHGIRVNCVNPSLVKAGMGEALRTKPEMEQNLKNLSMTKSLAAPEDIVNPIIFLLSDESKMISGHQLPVDGGSTSK